MTDEQGEPLFVLKDVCNALGITNTRNEAGLYEVIIRSDKAEALLR